MRCLCVCAVVTAFALTASMLAPAEAAEFLLRVGNVQVPAGTAVHGDAIVVGGSLNIAGTVEGDAVAIAGNIRVSGRVTGSVHTVKGNVLVYATAVVGGSATAWGGRVRIAPGAFVGGLHQVPGPPAPPQPSPQIPGPAFPPLPWQRPAPGPQIWWWVWPRAIFGGIVTLFQVLYWVVVLVFLVGFVSAAWLTALLFPDVVTSLEGVLARSPLAAFGVGLVGWALLFPLAVLLTLSVVGLALVLLIPVVVLVMVQFGTTAVALLVGRRIHRAGIGLPTVVGAVILAIAFAIPHLGWLLAGAVSVWGLGVVLLTFVERRRGRPLAPPAPPAPVQGM